MAKYVDGFLLVVPKGKAEEYRKMAEEGRASWMKPIKNKVTSHRPLR